MARVYSKNGSLSLISELFGLSVQLRSRSHSWIVFLLMMNEVPPSERPRERCLQTGPSCLSLRECVAVLLGSGPPRIGALGLAAQIVSLPGQGLSSVEEEVAFFTALEARGDGFLKTISGLGPANRARLLVAFEMGRRYSLYRSKRSEPTSSPDSPSEIAAKALKQVSQENRSSPHEWFGFIPIHRSGRLGDLCMVERGIRTHVNFDPAELFARLLALRPKGFILCHNHPSGSLVASKQDYLLTQTIEDLSLQLGLILLGHWIVTSHGEHWLRLES